MQKVEFIISNKLLTKQAQAAAEAGKTNRFSVFALQPIGLQHKATIFFSYLPPYMKVKNLL